MIPILRSGARRFPLVHGLTIVGRDPECCDIALDDPDVSNQHVLVIRDGAQWLAVDFKSSFGLQVNGRPVERTLLASGDVLRIGGQELTFEREAAPAKAADEPDSLSHALGDRSLGSSSLSASPVSVKLASLIRIGRELNSELNLDRLLHALIDRAMFVVSADRGMILLRRADGDRLEPWLYRVRGEQRAYHAVPIQISRQIASACAASREPVLSPDALADPRFRSGDAGVSSIEVHNIRSAICVPLIHHHELSGVLYVDTQLGGVRFSKEDLEFLTAFADQAAIALENARLYRLAYTDELTSCYVRRYFDRRLADELERVASDQTPVTVLFVDIDHFKKVNDTYGHAAGDAVLRQVSQVVRDSVRSIDVVARYGGEEFVILFPGQGLRECQVPAERIRKAVEAATFVAGEQSLRCTVSMGLATAPGHARAPADLIKRADEALYQAKRTGRNRLVLAE